VGVPHVRIELLGTLASGAERWSTGFSTAPPAGGGAADLESLVSEALETFQNDVWTATPTYGFLSNTVALTGARAQQLADDGTVLGTAEKLLPAPVPGNATSTLPPQCSIVISLRTGWPGPRGRGRMYFPCLAPASLTSIGRLSATAQEGLTTNFQTFFNDWNALSDTMPVAVASNVGGFVTTVSSVQVGSVVDTQRRRRDTMVESYYSLPVTP